MTDTTDLDRPVVSVAEDGTVTVVRDGRELSFPLTAEGRLDPELRRDLVCSAHPMDSPGLAELLAAADVRGLRRTIGAQAAAETYRLDLALYSSALGLAPALGPVLFDLDVGAARRALAEAVHVLALDPRAHAEAEAWLGALVMMRHFIELHIPEASQQWGGLGHGVAWAGCPCLACTTWRGADVHAVRQMLGDVASARLAQAGMAVVPTAALLFLRHAEDCPKEAGEGVCGCGLDALVP